MAMPFRVTENTVATRTLDNLQLSLQKMQDLQDKLSSGKQISKPSDDPAGAVEAMHYRSDQRRTEQYSRNAQDGIGWLGTADNTLTSSLDTIQRVRDLILQGANGTSDATSRAALAAEIDTAKQSLIGLANTTYGTHPIFAGTASPASQSPPVDTYAADGTYNGNTGAVMRTVGPNASVQVNIDGPAIFGDPTIDTLWNTLDDIKSHLTSTDPTDTAKLTNSYTSGSTTVQSDIDRLDGFRVNIQNRLSEIGARYHRVETMQSRADDNLLTIKSNLSQTEDVDIPSTIVALQLQSVAYQAALSATAKSIQPSLVDFLR